MTRTGKIARLSRATRDELNRRLDNGETGVRLVAWLNAQPETRRILAEKFSGRPITEQNLSEWKLGGYLDWTGRQEILAEAQELDADAAELKQATKGRLCDHLATLLAARYAKILIPWKGEVTEELTRQLRLLHGVSQDIVRLRRGEHQALQLDWAGAREDKQREKSNAEVVDHFKEWIERAEVHQIICDQCGDPGKKDRKLDELFELPPQEEP
jgi:hypothetical protein